MDISGTVVILDESPKAGFTGWGKEDVLTVLKPLVIPPQGTIKAEVDELDLNDLEGLDPEIARVIQERVKAKLFKKRKHAHRAFITY